MTSNASLQALLADLVTAAHLAIVAFMILGLAVVLVGGLLRWSWVRNPYFRFAHLGVMAYIAINAIRGELCFLTHWEFDLRTRAGQRTQEDYSFIGRLLHDILFVEVDQSVLNKIYLGFGAVVLLATLAVPPRLRRRASSPSDGAPPPPDAD